MSINIFTVPQIKTHNFNVEKLAVIREKLDTLKLRTTELESFAEATCWNQHQSVYSERNNCKEQVQEAQADYYAGTKAGWTALKERKQNDAEDTAPLRRVVTTDVESSLEDAIPKTTPTLQKASVHHQNPVQPPQGAERNMEMRYHLTLNFERFLRSGFAGCTCPFPHLLSTFEWLSGWQEQTTPSIFKRLFISNCSVLVFVLLFR